MSANLWQKEVEDEQLFVDLFSSRDKEFLQLNFMRKKVDNERPVIRKDAHRSVTRREAGNRAFKSGEYKNAIIHYNQSLCLAPPGTELVGMAYSNRAACFLQLNMYSECLVDIELAEEANYPNDKKRRLEERKEKCLKALEGGGQPSDDIGLKLSYDPVDTYSGVANVLNVVDDGQSNFMVTAKEYIGVGKTIAVEKAFATYSVMGYNLKCNICLKTNTNLVPCKKCAVAMFCHETCKNNPLHEGECGLVFSGNDNEDAIVLKEVRIILIVVDMFDNADELMDFVQKTIARQTMDLSDSVEKCRYRDFLKLPYSKAAGNSLEFIINLYSMYKLALEVPKIRAYFNKEKHRRFLMHLLGFHYRITDENSKWSKRMLGPDDPKKSIYTHGVMGLRNRLLHMSCAPNVMNSDHNDLSVFITIRPIQKGEPLLTYIYDYLLLEPKAVRQQAHWERFNTACKCSRCEGQISATPAQQRDVKADPDYEIVSYRQRDAVHARATGEMFVNFLNKYGHIPWCDEIGKVVDAYVCFLRNKMSGQAFSSDMILASIDALAQHELSS